MDMNPLHQARTKFQGRRAVKKKKNRRAKKNANFWQVA